MKMLVVGSGGREHALAWKLSQSPLAEKIFCAPGNGGTAKFATNVPISAEDVSELVVFAKKEGIDLTVVGPEAPLAKGITEAFKRNDLRVFGPTREAAQLESSKVFAKEFCRRYNIPTARSAEFTDLNEALDYVKGENPPLVVKADGLAAGKGVIICRTRDDAEAAVHSMLQGQAFGDASKSILIEEFLEGEEASFLAFSDGNHVLPLASSQDHKPIGDGDTGPNTGGMGAYSPAPVVDAEVYEKVMERVMLPTVRGMVTEGCPFIGILYAGLMIRDGDPYVLEYNVRFGDPEAQPLLIRLKNDLVEVLDAALDGQLNKIHLQWDTRPAVCVVMSSEGYPGSYEKGKEITGIAEAETIPDVKVFHAGTKWDEGKLVTSGGRVLGVTALGGDVGQAIERAYQAVERIKWDGCYCRRDIGKKALNRS
jgi:phosphoribosylamine--glycine ligase